MRPLTLELDGLRSYRRPTRINFGDVSLMAIVGDTGAGKSSLLEAITYGLYGASTWSGQPGDLIADGAQTMRVELTFLAGGKRWRATRAMSRSGYPEAVHRLECLDAPGQRFDGRGQVNAQVERLVGLDREGFLRAVILPQGHFADLLQATATDRTRILKNLFRVDELEHAREQAGQVLQRCRPSLAALRERRAGLLEDPQAAEAAATARLQTATTTLADLTTLRQRLNDLDGEVQEATGTAAALIRLVGELTDEQLTGTASRLDALVGRAAALARRRGKLETVQGDAAAMLQRLRGQLEAAAEAGESLDQLSAADSTLDALAEELPAIVEQLQALAEERAHLAGLAKRLASATSKVEDLTVRSARADETAGQQRQAAVHAEGAVQTARAALATARAAQAALLETSKALAGQERELARFETARAQAASTRRRAAEAYEAARVEHDRQRRAQAAVHAAHGVGPGDACPVCTQVLPPTFRPPQAPLLDQAQHSLDRAEQGLADAREAATRADTQAETAKRHAADLTTQRTAQAAALAARVAELAGTLGQPEPSPAATVLDATDEEVLSRLTTAASAAGQVAGAAEQQAATLREQLSAAQATLTSEQQAYQGQCRSHRQAADRLRGRYHTAARRAIRLPGRFRPVLPPTDRLLGTDLPPVQLDLAPLARLRAALDERLTELRTLEQQCREQADRHQQASAALGRLASQYRSEIDTQAQAARGTLSRLADRAARAAPHLGADPVAPTPDGDALAPLASWAHQVEAVAAGLAGRATQAAAEAAGRAARAQAASARLLADQGLATPEALDQARLQAASARDQAQQDADEARRQVPLAADLDRRIHQGGAFLAAVEAIYDLLADGRFVGYVVRRRQQALLGVASELLAELTGGRYGFAADFRVVDRLSGQPRSTRTLSGGESFLASLALALGMVELAGRAGGRLDAVFLDEGFGGLDTGSLDAAIDALETRAASGRLVAGISHVQLVAERITNVLGVRATPAGSEVSWLSTTERAEVVDQELAATIEAGLLR